MFYKIFLFYFTIIEIHCALSTTKLSFLVILYKNKRNKGDNHGYDKGEQPKAKPFIFAAVTQIGHLFAPIITVKQQHRRSNQAKSHPPYPHQRHRIFLILE